MDATGITVMSRRLVFILVVIAALLSGFSLALSRRDSRDWRANRSRRLLPFPWQDAASVTLRREGGETLRFNRAPGAEWRVELGDGKFDALDARAADSLAALATLARRNPLSDRPPPDPEKSLSLIAVSQLGQEVRLDFGDVQNSVRAVIVDKDPSVVYGVNQDLLAFLDWDRDRLRNMYLASVPGGVMPERILLSPKPDDPSLNVILARRPGEWVMENPARWPADITKTGNLIRWLDRLRADSVAADTAVDRNAYGLRQPTARIEAHYKTPEGMLRRRIDFGDGDGENGVFTSVEGRDPVFVTPREALAEVFMDIAITPPKMWRDFYRRRSISLFGNAASAAVRPVAFRIEKLVPAPALLTIGADDGADPGGVREWRGEYRDARGVRRFSVEPPGSGRPGAPLDALLLGLSEITIESFLSDVAPGPETARWTTYPAWRLSCKFSDGSESPVLTLYAKNAEGDLPGGNPYAEGAAGAREAQADRSGREGFAFSLSNRSAVLEADAWDAQRLCLPPYRYQSRLMLRKNSAEFVRAIIRVSETSTEYYRQPGDVNGQWWIDSASPEPLMDGNNRFVDMLDRLSRLEAERFVGDVSADESEFGLDRPEITAIVYSSSGITPGGAASAGEQFTLAIGAHAAGTDCRFARLNGEGPVFLLSENIVSDLIAEYR